MWNMDNKRKKRIRMKRSSKKQKTDVDLKEEKQLKTFMSIVPNEEEAINYEVLDKRLCLRQMQLMNSGRIKKLLILKSSICIKLSSHILMLEDGTAFHMLAERKYPLTKETLEKMLVLRLTAESESEAAFDLLRSQRPTGSKTDHSKKEKIQRQPWTHTHTSLSTQVVAEMHKEDQQATGNPNSLWVTSEERTNPQLNSGYDASAYSIAEADPRLSAPNDFIPQQQGMNKGTKNTSLERISVGTDPHILADQTQYVSEGLETVLTQPITGKEASSIARKVEEEEASRTIKLEDLAKLVSHVQPNFKDLDSPKDYPIIVVDDNDEDEEADKDEVHTTTNAETEDASVLKSSSPRSSLPTELKELSSKFNELIEEVKGLKKQVHELEIELPGDLKEIPSKPEDFTKTVTSLTSQVAELKTLKWELQAKFLSVPTQVEKVQAKLKTLDALPGLLNKVTDALNQFA
ncbi:hypothetical protein Tco_1202257 [Tanacetum coccineum]